jgi:hypothetical protein
MASSLVSRGVRVCGRDGAVDMGRPGLSVTRPVRRLSIRVGARLVQWGTPAAFASDAKEITRRARWIIAGLSPGRVTCTRCHRAFAITAATAEVYAVKRQPLPRVCPTCKPR